MRIFIAFLILHLFLTWKGFTQTVFLSTSENEIYQLNQDYSITEVATLTNLQFPIFDIAIAPDNTLYGITGNEIIEIDMSANSYSVIAQLPSTSDTPYTSLVCNNSNELFTINNDDLNLYKYDIQSNSVTTVTFLGFMTPGDVTFYKGKLIFPNFPNVKAYDFSNQTLTNIFCIPSQNGLIWGITNMYNDCDSDRIIASTVTNELWEFDIESGNTIILDFENLLNSNIYGLASTNEHFASNCTGALVSVKCELNISDNQNISTILYPNPAKDLIHIKSNYFIDFIEIYDITGNLKLSISNPNGFVNISQLKKGLHLVKIFSNSHSEIKKIIVE